MHTVYRILPVAIIVGVAALSVACSKYDYIRIATSNDPAAAISSAARSRVASYQSNPAALVQDIQSIKRDFDRLAALLRGEVGKTWGRRETVTPSNKRYVKYTQNYKSRAIIQFDRGLITVETLDETAPEKSLENAVVTTLLTPDDPRAVDLYSDRTVELTGQPYLFGLVADEKGRIVNDPEQAERYAAYLARRARKTRTIPTDDGDKTAHYVEMRMVSDFEHRQAQRYAASVDRYAGRFGVSRTLIYAVMKTESNFNPFAVSSAPAYGLMQLVPATGGRDAYRRVKGQDHTPTKEYLFEADNNIELGTAYLGMLDREYLARIDDPLTREYCVIAAYNGGAGNVLYTFSRDRDEAVAIINSLSPSEVYRRLRDQHPRDETRRYLTKVLDARKQFVNI